MHIASIRIQNFRALRDVEFPLARSTVIIGENNSGKSSVLDCISLALGRRWGQRGTGFGEYDLSLLVGKADSEEDALEASIELRFCESTPNEWPEEITTTLHNIVQTNPHNGCNSITLRVTYSLNPLEQTYEPNWSFVDINGAPIGSGGAKRGANFSQFFKYVPIFMLSALRDSSEEFSSHSQFWGRLLKAVEITPEQKSELDDAIEELNTKLLAADPRIEQTLDRLKDIQSVIAQGAVDDVSIRALPMKIWQLLARSEIILKSHRDSSWLPLERQGQGIKSLSVIYLFNAFIQRLLKEKYGEHSEPIVALEEPEVHLHPQAARALWSQVDLMPGQKIITTHSPYFMQFVPIMSIRLLRSHADGVRVHFVPETISTPLPGNEDLTSFIAKYDDIFSYDSSTGIIAVTAPLTETQYRELLQCYTSDEDRIHHSVIRSFRDDSRVLVINDDLEALEDWARRTRGEIFFSRAWILCEGQSEVFLLDALFDALDFNLDTRSISLIDYQTNGNPRAFASLARAFDFPWFLLSDGDQQGKNTLTSLKSVGFTDEEITSHTLLLPDGKDLEAYIVDTCWRDLALSVAKEFDATLDDNASDDLIVSTLRANKPIWARRFGSRLRQSPPASEDIPEIFQRVKQFITQQEPADAAADDS